LKSQGIAFYITTRIKSLTPQEISLELTGVHTQKRLKRKRKTVRWIATIAPTVTYWFLSHHLAHQAQYNPQISRNFKQRVVG
jgi:type VI protein secretion system component VasF